MLSRLGLKIQERFLLSEVESIYSLFRDAYIGLKWIEIHTPSIDNEDGIRSASLDIEPWL